MKSSIFPLLVLMKNLKNQAIAFYLPEKHFLLRYILDQNDHRGSILDLKMFLWDLSMWNFDILAENHFSYFRTFLNIIIQSVDIISTIESSFVNYLYLS